MIDKRSSLDIPLSDQEKAWNDWNLRTREVRLTENARREAEVILEWLESLCRNNLKIADVGCGAGWMSERVARFGSVTGFDIADDVIQRARTRLRHIEFFSGDFMSMSLPSSRYDVVVSVDALAHFADQAGFMNRCADMLRPGGLIILATQNRPVLERWKDVPGPQPGQIRQWVDVSQLRALLGKQFEVVKLISLLPDGHEGFLRIVNSPKLNRLLGFLVSSGAIQRFKERFMLGQTLVAMARLKD